MIADEITENILKAEKLEISSDARKFLEYITEKPDLITMMKRPTELLDNLDYLY